MLTTAEAAQILGISPRRVRALIASGDLEAQQVGRAWLVDEQSAHARAAAPKLKGRPRHGEKDVQAINAYLLMNQNHPVARFEYNSRRDAVVSLQQLEDVAWAPLGACSSPGHLHPDYLRDWISRRAIPETRPNLFKFLEDVGLAGPVDIAFSSLGLSLSDQYWFQPVSAGGVDFPLLDWHDINYFENGFDDEAGRALLVSGKPEKPIDRSPSATTNGMLEKCWVLRDGTSYLMKGATPGTSREPYSELLATKMLSRLLAPSEFVPYRLAYENGQPYSLCPCMIDETKELIPAADVAAAYGLRTDVGLYDAYTRTASELAGRELGCDIDKMVVCDYLMANDDRHLFNFGLIRDVESLQIVGVAPLFDNGCAFFARASLQQMRAKQYHYTAHPFAEAPLRQLALAQDYSWFDPSALDGFADEVGETLSKNEELTPEFVEHAVRHVERAVRRVTEFAEEA